MQTLNSSLDLMKSRLSEQSSGTGRSPPTRTDNKRLSKRVVEAVKLWYCSDRPVDEEVVNVAIVRKYMKVYNRK